MARMRTCAGGIALLAVSTASAPVGAQGDPRFEVAAGVQFGVQDPERPVTPGWVLSGAFEALGQEVVVEGAWHRETYLHLRPHFHEDTLTEEFTRATHRSRYSMVMAGIRSGRGTGRLSLHYQLLLGGFAARFRTDYEYPASIDVEAENAACGGYIDGVLVHPCTYVPYPEFDEEGVSGFVAQPGIGLDVNLLRRLALRFAADMPIFAGADYVVARSRLSARMVVGF